MSQKEIRLCVLVKWPDFNGFGFNLHAEKSKTGQYIGKVEAGSPAALGGVKEGDRILEVDGVNIGNENHQQVVARIKAGNGKTSMLVVDKEAEAYYREQMIVVTSDLPAVRRIECPPSRPSAAATATSDKFEVSKATLSASLPGPAATPESLKPAVTPEPPKLATADEPAKPAAAVAEPAKPAVVPEPEKSAVLPEPAKPAVVPEPEKSAVLPEPAKPAVVPEPEKSAVVPEPAKPAAVPEPAKPATAPAHEPAKAVAVKQPTTEASAANATGGENGVASQPSTAINSAADKDVDPTKGMTAKELKESLKSKRRSDVRKQGLPAQDKYDLFQKL